VDCSYIKVHRDGANPIGGQASQAMGRTKGGLNTKLAAVVDGVGIAVGLNLTSGQQHDLRACKPLETKLHGRWAVADKAFDSNGLRHRLAASGAMVCIPPKGTRRIAVHFKNYFARIKRHRRIATRYEKLAVTFLGFVQFATVLDWLTHEV
jgi:transposase